MLSPSMDGSSGSDDTLTNWTRAGNGPQRGRARIEMTLGVTYETKADEMLAITEAIQHLLEDHNRVFRQSIIVNFVAFGASSLDILIVCTVRIAGYSDLQQIKQEINIGIMRLLENHGLTVAFPTRTIYIETPEPDEPSIEGDNMPSDG